MDYDSVGVSLTDQEFFNAKLSAKMPWLGGHCGAFDVGADFLVSSCDSIGTKIKLYQESKEKYEGISIKNLSQDLVAMVFNDIVCSGATPLFMSDYLAVPAINDELHEFIDGLNETLKTLEGRPPLISGNTPIQPEIETLDIAGFGVGACPKKNYIDGKNIKDSDVILGLRSSGFHSDGYALIRKIWNDIPVAEGDQEMIIRLLTPSRIYVNTILSVLRKYAPFINGICHITSGGRENLNRLMGENLNLRPRWNNDWTRPEEFDYIQKNGNISDGEMRRVFNDGIGMMLVVDPNEVVGIVEYLEKLKEEVVVCGTISTRFKQTVNTETGRVNESPLLN
jgi:phosphoribosylformylglycinamidine cyclo-ligase|tara:strand:- start:8400 stop:9413 length:1014 start_codon:yes stop_codon:yes gene_type:complete